MLKIYNNDTLNFLKAIIKYVIPLQLPLLHMILVMEQFTLSALPLGPKRRHFFWSDIARSGGHMFYWCIQSSVTIYSTFSACVPVLSLT
ncbi:hypothetical protein EB796_004636 [Bugula neritina]|uniref:Uncharacterized protein n=1 Tax=Bugula neritina TaxID=10212 RepID=A0A7J7KFR7_BUGNE|nr:hypothetical protein EB796_004636 [Bugula neritina]